jgi:hypothetical protein
MLLVMLGMCVFFWGFGYKLSLYRTRQSSTHRIPVAKLMSRNEDPDAADGVRSSHANSTSLEQGRTYTFVSLAVLLAGIAQNRADRGRQYLSLPKPWCLRFSAVQSAFFLRPPPVFNRF